MNSNDMRNGFVKNLEWEAKKQAQLDSIYENERKKYNNQSNSQGRGNNVNTRLNALEQRCARIESRLNELHDMIVTNPCPKIGNNLFVFAPNQNVNAGIAFSLTESQFNELVKKITDK